MGDLDKRVERLERVVADASKPELDIEVVWDDDVEIPEGNPLRWRDERGVLHIRLVWTDLEEAD